MKQINRDWLESYKQIPRTDNTIYKNIYNPHESSIQGNPLSYFEKGALPAYGMGTQEMEQQLRAHPAFSSLPSEIRDLPLSEMFNYFKTPEMRNRIKFNQGLESLRNQREQNYNTQLKGLETQHNQKMTAQQQAQQRSQQQAQKAQEVSLPWGNMTYWDATHIQLPRGAPDALKAMHFFANTLGNNYKNNYNKKLPINLYDVATGRTASYPLLNDTKRVQEYQRLYNRDLNHYNTLASKLRLYGHTPPNLLPQYGYGK